MKAKTAVACFRSQTLNLVHDVIREVTDHKLLFDYYYYYFYSRYELSFFFYSWARFLVLFSVEEQGGGHLICLWSRRGCFPSQHRDAG